MKMRMRPLLRRFRPPFKRVKCSHQREEDLVRMRLLVETRSRSTRQEVALVRKHHTISNLAREIKSSLQKLTEISRCTKEKIKTLPMKKQQLKTS